MFILFLGYFIGCARPITEDTDLEIDTATEHWEASPKTVVGSYGPVTMSSGTYIKYRFTKYKGYTYDICVDMTSGDVALYSDYRGYPTTKSYQYKMDASSGNGRECLNPITATSTGYYYVSVYAKKKSTGVTLSIER